MAVRQLRIGNCGRDNCGRQLRTTFADETIADGKNVINKLVQDRIREYEIDNTRVINLRPRANKYRDNDNAMKRMTELAQIRANNANGEEQPGKECVICMNDRVNAVIYRCFPCAEKTHRRFGECPICCTPIIDVIRCYPA
ncbi:hypothetical protein GPALN_003256 [Globodera pallida]|nr:hypothetical protein GPALN_003256 [Globodera pallida]